MMKKFFKQSIGILTLILLLGSVFAAVQQWNNSKLEISQKRMLFTDTGLPGGNCILDVNSGGKVIACTGIQDIAGNYYITGGALTGYLTGFTETDPVRNSVSGNYVGMSMTGDWNTAYSWGNHSGLYIPETYLTGVISTLGLDTEVPTTKAVVDYVSGFANDIGPGLASGGYYITGYANYGRVWMSGGFLSFQILTGGNWEEQNYNPFGYITGYTETDPIYSADITGLSNTYIPYWNGSKFANTNITYTSSQTYIGDPADGASISLQSGSAVYISPDSLGTQLGIFPNAISFDANTSRLLFNNTGVLLKSIIGKVDIQSVSGTYISGGLYDSLNNPYITGYTETDPIWITVSGNYCPITIYTGLTNNYIPYRSGNRFYNSNMLFYTNTHVGTYSAGDRALFNIRKIGSNLKGINITLYTGGFYDGIGLDIRASKPIITTTQDIGDPLNTTNIANNSDNNGGYFITNYVSNKGGYSSMISKGGIVGVANGASVSTSSLAGFYIMSGHSSLASTNGSWRIVMSGVNLSIQILSGGAWIEKGHFTP